MESNPAKADKDDDKKKDAESRKYLAPAKTNWNQKLVQMLGQIF